MMQMSVTKEMIEGLETIVVGPADNSELATAAAIFCHGFGAPGTDLVGISQELIQLGRGKLNQVVFLFPQAPLSLAEMGMPDGRAWWPLNMQQLMDISDAENFDDLAATVPEQLPSESERIGRMVDAVKTKYSLPISKIVIGGFSQGAMLTCDAALRLNSQDQTAGLAGLIIWSGTLLVRSLEPLQWV